MEAFGKRWVHRTVAPLVAWGILALLIVPRVIGKAYRGEGLEALNPDLAADPTHQADLLRLRTLLRSIS